MTSLRGGTCLEVSESKFRHVLLKYSLVTVMITPSGGMVRTGGEQDPFRSLNVKVLTKTFTLIPNMAIFVV